MIHVKNKTLQVPVSENKIGVVGDSATDNRVFVIPRADNGQMDLSALTFKLDLKYSYNNSTNIASLDKVVSDDEIRLTWNIVASDIPYYGAMFGQLRAFNEDGKVKWQSFIHAFYVEESATTTEGTTSELSELQQLESTINGLIEDVGELETSLVSTITTTLANVGNVGIGTTVTATNSSSTGYKVNDVYINKSSFDLWKCTATDTWELQGNIKGATGDTGATGATGPKGDKGDTGATGEQGEKGEKGDKGDKGDTGETGATGPKGDKGDTGETGAAGADGINGQSFTVKALYATLAELQAAHPTGSEGDAYSVGSSVSSVVYIWDVDANEWNNIGSIQGPQGAQGPKGDTGETGATGPAGADGATGPAGADGATGPAGADGATGPAGVAGAAGADGTSAYVHVKYSASADGSDFVDTPTTATKYIGFYSGSSATAPSSKTDYTWSELGGGTSIYGTVDDVRTALESTDIIDTITGIESNTAANKAAGALALKAVNSNLNNGNLLFVVESDGKLHAYIDDGEVTA